MTRIRGMAEMVDRKLRGLKKATESKVLKAFASNIAAGDVLLKARSAAPQRLASASLLLESASGGTLLKRGVFLPSAPQTSPQATCSSSPPQADAPQAQRSSRHGVPLLKSAVGGCSSRAALLKALRPLLFGPLFRRTAKSLAFALIFGLWTCVPVTTYAATTITKSIAAASDDAEEEGPTGTTPNRMWLNSSDIELVSDIEPAICGNQQIGLRFTAMTIPAGATITDAYLTFRAIAADSPMTNSDATNLTIKGQLIANAPTFTTTSGNISSRTTTTASASWTPGSWTTGSDYNSPSIVSVIQEIVDQGTWASGNAIAIIITGTGHRASQAYDSDSATAAKLVVTYSMDLGISSAANQTFKIGDSTTAISAIKVRDDPTTPKITAANDIRIRIPSSFTMTWDTSDTTAAFAARPRRRSPR